MTPARLIKRAAWQYKVSFINVDLPEPDTPVMQVSKPIGNEMSTFFRLLPWALRMTICLSLSTGVSFSGAVMPIFPDKY
jgi:hypothetical protein